MREKKPNLTENHAKKKRIEYHETNGRPPKKKEAGNQVRP